MVARSTERRPPDTFLEFLYPSPRPLATLEEWRRAHHDDLPLFTDLELARELARIWRRLTFQWPPLDDWLWDRRRAIFAERERRRAESGQRR